MKIIIFIWLEAILCIAIHELSHAIVALLFNQKIEKIQIGYCKLFNIKKLFVGILPLGGKVIFKIDESITSIKMAILYGVGPLATTILLIISLNSYIFFKNIIQIVLISQLYISVFGENSDVRKIFEIIKENKK